MSSISKVGNSTKKYLQANYKQGKSKHVEAIKHEESIEKDYSSAVDFMKVALLRNDESIRYSESKAGFLFSFTGIIIGLFYNDIVAFKTVLLQKDFWGMLAIIAITITVIGVIVVTFSTFMVVIPRLRVSKVPTLLYFGYIKNIPESKLYDIASNLDSVKALKDLTTQVRVTSIIVSKKYYYVRTGLFGALAVFLGWITATSIVLLTQ